jgi:hypothetical protein
MIQDTPAVKLQDPLVIVENDTQAAVAAAAGLAAHAITNAYSALLSPSAALLAALGERASAVIIGPSNADDSTTKRDGMKSLAAQLRSKGHVCVYMQCPAEAKKRGRPQAVAADPVSEIDPIAQSHGIDAWLASAGAEVVRDRINWHIKKETERLDKARDGGFRALGREGKTNYLWSNKNSTQYEIVNSALASETELQALCGVDWCESNYGEPDKAGKLRVDYRALASDILRSIEKVGQFSPDNIRGAGVWIDDKDKSALVVNSRQFFRTDGKTMDRVGDYVYPAVGDLGITKETPQATVEQMRELLKLLQGWDFSRDSDAVMLLGWISLAYLCGALEWRPHCSVTGERGSGKSTLITLFKDLLGGAAMSLDGGTSAAGIRAKMRRNSIAIILDEAESKDARKMTQHMNFFRTGSSGGTRLQSNQDQQSIEYTIRSIGMLSSIVPPVMEASDQSRFLFIQINGVKNKLVKPHLIADHEAAKALGKTMFSRTLNLWPRMSRAQQLIREVAYETLTDTRPVDTLSPCIAAAWCQINDAEMTIDDARQFLAELDLEADFERMDEIKDHEELFDHMMSSVIEVCENGKVSKLTLSSVCEGASVERSTKLYKEALEKVGIVAFADQNDHSPWIGIWSGCPGFRALFRGTKFAQGDLEAVLRRLPNCEKKKRDKAHRLAGKPRKVLAMRLDINDPES